MAVHTPDDLEKILEDDEENDYSKTDSSGAQEKGSNNFVDPGPNFDNILQVFQDPEVPGFFKRADDQSRPTKFTIFPV